MSADNGNIVDVTAERFDENIRLQWSSDKGYFGIIDFIHQGGGKYLVDTEMLDMDFTFAVIQFWMNKGRPSKN